jgi:alpha-glucosidase
VTRHATRWTKPGGDVDAVARQSIALLSSFPGTLGIYQGEELGQTETDIEFHELQDLGYIAFWPEIRGRDGCRTPMVWEAGEPNGGFSTGTPWLPVKEPQAVRAVDKQEARNDSVLHSYRASLAFRKSHKALSEGTTDFLDLPEPVLGLRRTLAGQVLTCLFNLSERPLALTLGGEAQPVGPLHAEVEGATVHLPAHGYVYLESAAPVTVASESLGEPGSSRPLGFAS